MIPNRVRNVLHFSALFYQTFSIKIISKQGLLKMKPNIIFQHLVPLTLLPLTCLFLTYLPVTFSLLTVLPLTFVPLADTVPEFLTSLTFCACYLIFRMYCVAVLYYMCNVFYKRIADAVHN